ncbi:MAG TPA: thioesterase family protein [Ramlibacter sp.]|nr:thioesterase family protein [Ramlibacter sp.]
MTAPAHVFDQAVALQAAGDGLWQGHTSPAYANMVGPFGGITAAQALNAVLQHPQRLGEPVAFTVNFAAALADGPFTVQARPARTNRSTQHWVVEVRQGGEVVVTATAFTATRRETWGSSSEAPMPAAAAPGTLPMRDVDRGKVEWIRRYDMRFVTGGLPTRWDGEDLGLSDSLLWVRDAPERPLDFASLTALSDVFFPRVWRRRPKPVPIGTVSMTVYFHADTARLQAVGSGYLLGQARAHAFHGGYFDQTAHLWSPDGHLLVTSHQVVYYKE